LNLSCEGLTEDRVDFLSRQENLLLLVDDAHRLSETLGMIAQATAPAKSIRLLIATRPQAREAVISQLNQNGYTERIDTPLDLPRWKQSEIEKLAEQILDPSHRLHAPRLAALADRCPLLVILGGGLINSGAIPETMVEETVFRERVFKGFLEEFLHHQGGHKQDRIRRLIRFLSFVSPTPKDQPLLSKAAEIAGCSPLDVAEDLEALQAAGLVVSNREGIRLYPDLFSDAVLLDACLDRGGHASQLCETVVQKLPFESFPALLRNLAQADWETRARRGVSNSLFDPIWQEFVTRFERATWWERRSLLGQWSPFAVFQPERTLELARLTLRSC
jgi:hypothetical protein